MLYRVNSSANDVGAGDKLGFESNGSHGVRDGGTGVFWAAMAVWAARPAWTTAIRGILQQRIVEVGRRNTIRCRGVERQSVRRVGGEPRPVIRTAEATTVPSFKNTSYHHARGCAVHHLLPGENCPGLLLE
jgi:hypothetical protein